MTDVHSFQHHAMATHFQVRLAGADKSYAAQAAQAAFALVDELEGHLSRFRVNSGVSQIAALAPGESLRLSEPVFTCLQIAKQMELATAGAFSVSAAALQNQSALPQWTLLPGQCAIRCDAGRLQFDLGAIGKGFALDRMAALLRDWDWPAFLLVAGGSSILAGDAPADLPGWSCGLGEDHSPHRFWLTQVSVSGSGLAVKGKHILDPRSGQPARRQNRAWALCDTAAESDALSTAAMVLDEAEMTAVLAARADWLAVWEDGAVLRFLGERPLPRLEVGS